MSSPTASVTSWQYRSKPTAAMWPDCSAPSMLPAPRISRAHHPLEATLVHLPVRDADARLGDELVQLLAHVVDVLHSVVDEEHLALAQKLPPDRLGRGALVELAHIGEDGLAVLGWRVHEGEIA